MIQKVIVLIGKQGSRKTTLLNRLANKMSDDFHFRKLVVKEQRTRDPKESELVDRSYVLIKGEVVIGVCTQGDSADCIVSYSKPLLGCDVIITAAHSEGDVRKAFDRLWVELDLDSEPMGESAEKDILKELEELFPSLPKMTE